jgi:hypothetical protein
VNSPKGEEIHLSESSSDDAFYGVLMNEAQALVDVPHQVTLPDRLIAIPFKDNADGDAADADGFCNPTIKSRIPSPPRTKDKAKAKAQSQTRSGL